MISDLPFAGFLSWPVLPAFRPRHDHIDASPSDRVRGLNPCRFVLFPGWPQTTRQSHSAIFAITSPDNNSAADQTSAETKLAI
jgi:hypothetical protein